MLVKFYKYGRWSDENPLRVFLTAKETGTAELIQPICDGLDQIIFLGRKESLAYLAERDVPASREQALLHRAEMEQHTVKMFGLLMETVRTEWVYTSGGLCFAPSDKPSIDAQNDIMADFERFMAAGIETEVMCHWVRLIDKGRLTLHFAILRRHLGSGKSFNPAPPGHQRPFNAWRDYVRVQYGLSGGCAEDAGSLRKKMICERDHREQYNVEKYETALQC